LLQKPVSMSKHILFIFCLFFSLNLAAQVVDDSTKQIYGNKTVEYFYENDILRNISRSYNPDSSLKDYHYPNPVRKSGWMYQDLGNVGTSSKSILFQKNPEVGQTMGMDVNQLYTPNMADFKYYNTRSPYTYLGYQQGGGHIQANVIHSQNVHSRLNLTFNLQKMNSEKQYGFSRAGELLVNHWRYSISSNYVSKNEKYRLLATFYHFNQKQFEQGGILNGDTISVKSIEKKYDRTYNASLTGDVYNRERWNNLHVYQQFLMKNALQTFHVLDYERKFYGFADNSFKTNYESGAYGVLPASTMDTLAFHYRFQSLSNKFGFKGFYKGVNYQAYARFRQYNLTNDFHSGYSQNWTNEIYVGGLLGYVFKDSTNTLDVKAELSPNPDKGLFYRLDATLFYKGFEFSFFNSSSPAGLFYSNFQNGVLDFTKNEELSLINSRHFEVKFPVSYRRLRLIPEARWTGISNYTYLNSVSTVEQLSDLNLLSLNGTVEYEGKNFSASYQYFFNTSSDRIAYPIPKHIHTTNLEWNFLYAKVLRIYLGTDIFFKSGYYANSYSPLLNQFYRNNHLVGGVPVMDLYVKFPISKGRIALNYTYFNKMFGPNGVFTTPKYLTNPSSLMIKVDWPLFD
jgi:hypothetical protein